MSSYLGIDTSNYTTSVSLLNDQDLLQVKKLLKVKKGGLGLRQSEAVFQHINQLPALLENILQNNKESISSVGVSKSPRDEDGSYMPCFTVGLSSAKMIADVLGVPLYKFSHQSGHIVAALYSAGRLDLLDKKFLAFHVSGGTTEAVIVSPDEKNIIKYERVFKTLDLNAGQVIDRVGLMLGLDFPAGRELEKLALNYNNKIKVKPAIKGVDCCLSGVENLCEKMKQSNKSDEEIARFCLEYILQTLDVVCEKLLLKHGELPIVFSGGVMSNSIINKNLSSKYGAIFSKPEFSSDNASGIAVLTSIKAERL